MAQTRGPFKPGFGLNGDKKLVEHEERGGPGSRPGFWALTWDQNEGSTTRGPFKRGFRLNGGRELVEHEE